MRLYDEISGAFAESRCTFFPSGGGYFQGVKGLSSFSCDEIVLLFSKTKVSVKGAELSIKKYYDGDMEISGKIYEVGVVGEPSKGNGRRRAVGNTDKESAE